MVSAKQQDRLRLSHWVIMAWVVLAVFGACVISPQPEPPSIDSRQIAVTLTNEEPGEPDPDTINFTGQPGAVRPGGSRLTLINVDDAQAWVETVVEQDGSFHVSMPGQPGEEFLLRLTVDDRRGDHMHVIIPDDDGQVDESDWPMSECLWLEPDGELDFGGVELGDVVAFEVGIRNDCDDEVLVEDVWMALQGEDEELCNVEFELCLEGDTPTAEVCDEELEACESECYEEYYFCIDEGTPEDECLDDVIDCSYFCIDDSISCVTEECEDEYFECSETPSGLYAGFDIFVSYLSLEVPPETSRNIIVTFSPFDDGVAEDLLIIGISSPSEERRSLVITGNGIESSR